MNKLYTSIAAVVMALTPLQAQAHTSKSLDDLGRYTGFTCGYNDGELFVDATVLYTGSDRLPTSVVAKNYSKGRTEKVTPYANGQMVVSIENMVTPTTATVDAEIAVQTYICPKPRKGERKFCKTPYGMKVSYSIIHDKAVQALQALNSAQNIYKLQQ